MNITADELHYLEISGLAARIESREVTPVGVTRAQFDRIAAMLCLSWLLRSIM